MNQDMIKDFQGWMQRHNVRLDARLEVRHGWGENETVTFFTLVPGMPYRGDAWDLWDSVGKNEYMFRHVSGVLRRHGILRKAEMEYLGSPRKEPEVDWTVIREDPELKIPVPED